MAKQPKAISMTFVLGMLFTLIALVAIVALLRLKSLADSTTQYAGVGNTAPSVDTITVLDGETSADVTLPALGLTVNEGLMKDVTITGTVTDLNGFLDLDSIDIYVHRSDKMDEPSGSTLPVACTEDDNDCYYANVTSFTQTGTNTATFSVVIAVANYIDPTDPGSPNAALTWTALGIVNDNNAEWGYATASFEVQSLAAFAILPGTVNYGSLSLNAYSSQKTVRFYNTGNRDVQSEVKADAAMHSNLSGFADIPTNNVRFTHDDGVTFANATGVTTNDQTLAICLPQQTTDGAGGITSVPSYFALHMPASGVNGVYQNVLTFTATASGNPVCSTQVPALNCGAHPDDPECQGPVGLRADPVGELSLR